MLKTKLFFGALALTFASSAQAQTWIGYSATGTGVSYSMDSNYQILGERKPVSFEFNFAVLLSGIVSGPNGQYFTSDGSTFTARIPPYQNYTISGGSSGALRAYESIGYPSGGYLFDASVSYDDIDNIGGFPLAVASSLASGNVYQQTFNGLSSVSFSVISGSFTSFRVLGPVAGAGGLGLITSPLPEPATWAMMIAGFGMMGAAMRTRRRSTKVSFA